LLVDVVVESDSYRRRSRDVNCTSRRRVIDDLGRVPAAGAECHEYK